MTLPNETPRVSVVMPVRNAGSFLGSSIESILDQTYGDFEFVILDDASQDGSWDELLAWKERDDRIRLLRSDDHLGPARCSNRVVEASKGALVARMDADDIARPDRLRRQVATFDDVPDVVLVGALAEGIDAQGRRIRSRDASRALRRSPYSAFPHGSAMFRRDAFDAVGGYREVCDGWEDVDLFLRLQRTGTVLTIIDPLYSYRFHPSTWTLAVDDSRLESFALERVCMTSYRDSGQYEEILSSPDHREPSPSDRLNAYVYLSSFSIWSGNKPPVLSATGATWSSAAGWISLLHALLNATFGRIAPRSLRGLLGGWIRLKDRVAVMRLGSRDEVRWLTGH
jgi:glycosyltransferase involved in cell wall biosynthesis